VGRDGWEADEQLPVVKDAVTNALSDPAEFAGIVRPLDADRVMYAFTVRGEDCDLLGWSV